MSAEAMVLEATQSLRCGQKSRKRLWKIANVAMVVYAPAATGVGAAEQQYKL